MLSLERNQALNKSWKIVSEITNYHLADTPEDKSFSEKTNTLINIVYKERLMLEAFNISSCTEEKGIENVSILWKIFWRLNQVSKLSQEKLHKLFVDTNIKCILQFGF